MDKLEQMYNLYVEKGLISELKSPFEKWSKANPEMQIKLFELGQKEGLFGENTQIESFSNLWKVKKKDDSQPIAEEEVMESSTEQVQDQGGSSDVSISENVSDYETKLLGGETDTETETETEVVETDPARSQQDRVSMPDAAEDNTILEDVVGKNYLTNFIGDIYRAGKQGFVQGNTSDEGWELMYKGADANPEDIMEFLQAQEEIAALGESDEMQEFNRVYEDAGGGALGFLKGLAYAGPLNVVAQLGAQTMMQMLNTSSATAAGTVVAGGAGVGSLAGGVGAIPGAIASLPAAYAASGAALETGLSFAEFLREAVEENGDSFDQKGISKVLADEDKMFKIRAKSAGRGAIIGIVDRYSLKMGGKIIANQVVKGASKGKRALTAMGVEAGGGGVGETIARVAVGQDLDAREIGFETIGGTGKAGVSYAYGSLLARPTYKINSDTKEGEVDVKTMTEMIMNSDDKDFAAMGITIENDPALKDLADKRKTKLRIQNTILREIGQQNIPNKETLDELVSLEVEKESLGAPTTEAGKNRLKEIQERIIGIYKGDINVKVTQTDDGQGNTTTETIEVSKEYATEKLLEEGNENPTEQDIAEKQAQLMEEGQEAINKLKQEQDAIQESSPESVDVQEQTEVSSEVGDGNTETVVTEESDSQEGPSPEEVTQEEINEESRDLETLIDGEPTVVENTEVVEEESRPLKEKIRNIVDKIADGKNGFAQKWFNPIVMERAGITKDEDVKEYYIQSIENGEVINDANKEFLNSEFERLGITPPTTDNTTTQEVTRESAVEVNNETEGLTIINSKTGEVVEMSGANVTTPKINKDGTIENNSTNLFIADDTVVEVDPIYEDTKAQEKQESLITELAKKAVKSIKQILPDVQVVLHRTEAAYNKATNQNSQGSKGKGGSRGMYSQGTNTIHINMPHANTRTIAHEVFHAVVMSKFDGANLKAVTDRMVKSLQSSIKDPKIKAELDAFVKKYTGDNKKFRSEEYLAELTGMLADNYTSLNTEEKSLVKRLLQKLGSMLGIKAEVSTQDEVVNLLNVLSGKIREGGEVSMQDIQGLQEVDKLNTEEKIKEQKDEDDAKKALQEYEAEIDQLPSGIFAYLFENLGKVHVKDFDQYGDPNNRKGTARDRMAYNRLLRKTGPRNIDTVEDPTSDDIGFLDPQVIIDYLDDVVSNPGKYTRKNIQKARDAGLTRDQKFEESPIKKVTRLAQQNGINQSGFFSANLFNPQALRKQLEAQGYGLKEAYKSYGDGALTGYYITKNGRKFNIPSNDRMQVIFNPQDSNNEVVSKAREMDFSDASIKDYLTRIRKVAASVADALLKSKTEREINIPVVFGNVEGGMKVGENMFNDVNTQLTEFITKNNPNNAEIREKGISLLEKNEEFQAQPKSVQNDLVSGFDRSLQTTANRTVQKKISAIRKEIRTRKEGASSLAKSKARIKQFIRTQLPVSKKYTKADILKLTNLIANSSEKTFLADAERVLQVVEKQRAVLKKSLFKDILNLVNKKASKKTTDSGKVRSKGLDAAGQQFFRSVKTILTAAIKGDVDVLASITEKLRADNVEIGGTVINVNDALTKELNGEQLTVKEQMLLEQIYALDTFGNISNMSLEDVQSLYDGFKDVRAESIKRLAVKRLARAENQNKLNEESSAQIKENYPFLYNEDGTLKDKNDLDRDASSTWNDFQKLKIWKGLQNFVDRYPFTTGLGISDFFRNKIAHLGTITNIMDNVAKGNNFFRENVYDKLNLMHTKALEGERAIIKSNDKGLGKIANTIEGITKGYAEWKSKIPRGQRTIYGKFKGGARERSHTIDEMMRIYALSKNDIQRAKLEKMGYDAEVLDQITREITPLATEFIDKTVDYLSNEYFEETNSTYRQVNDVNLGFVANYFPTQSISPSVDGLITEGDFNGVFNAEYDSAFKSRIDRESDVKIENLLFTNVLESHIKSMERYKSYAEGTKTLNNIFKSPDVNTLAQELGIRGLMKNMVNMAVNPNSGLKLSNTKLDTLQRKFTSFALSFKFMQIPKQATSFINAFEDYNYRGEGKTRIPGMDTLGFMMDMAKIIATLPKQIKKARSISADFSARLDQGLEGDVYGLESGSRVFKPLRGRSKVAKFIQALKTAAASPTVIGDVMGVMGYMANYNRNIANGMSKADALQAFNNYNATQQSRRSTDKNMMQLQGDGLTRAFTMFGSTLFLQMNKVMSSTANIMKTLKEKKVPTAKDTRALSLNFALANMLFIATANIFKLSEGGEDEEEAMEKIKDAAMGLTLLYQVPLIGGGAESVVNAIKGKRSYNNDVVNPYTSVFRKVSKGFKKESTFDALRPVAEIALGAQLDPFIGLFNTLGVEIDDASDEENLFRMLGVSPSYQPNSVKSGSKSKEGMGPRGGTPRGGSKGKRDSGGRLSQPR